MIKRIITILFICISGVLLAQEIAVGDWREHLPYSDAISVSYGNSIVYCATNSAVFTYDQTENTVEKLSLVNGLSDIGVSKVKFNPFNQRIVIAYKNGNVDIIDENKKIINISFIKTSNVIGEKTINHIFFRNELAYLSTAFGIVVLNTDRLEIVETYFFGPSGANIDTKAVTFDTTKIYAATDQGVFFANLNATNLADFNSWSQIPELGTTNFSGIVFFANRVFASSDSILFSNTGSSWESFLPDTTDIDNIDLTSLNTPNDILVVNKRSSTEFYEESLNLFDRITDYNGNVSISSEAVIDANGIYWLADEFTGLTKIDNNGSIEFIFPNGPNSSSLIALDVVDGDLWFVNGFRSNSTFLAERVINHRSNNQWSKLPFSIQNEQGSSMSNLVSVAINPNNPNNVFAGSWIFGLLEFENENLTQVFNSSNSLLDSNFFGPSVSIGTVEFDNDNNLWVASSFSENILAVKTPNDEWYNYSFPGLTILDNSYEDMIIDQNNYKWIVSRETSNLIVFDDNNTLDDKSDDRSKLIPKGLNNPNLQEAEILSIVEDLDGEIWMGTSEGVAVLFGPSQVFAQEIRGEQIFIQQDGNVEILLGPEVINAIAVDGANRKWFGTTNSGAFLMSENGEEQLLHFTRENSPLLSNNVLDIDINDITGEVFFATEKGLISYRGTATESKNNFNNVLVYPNPVRPDFDGLIAIKGLTRNADVKITDVSGNIVFETKSLGGQAVWDGKNLNGERVKTGVYMLFSSSENGDQKNAAKILFIN